MTIVYEACFRPTRIAPVMLSALLALLLLACDSAPAQAQPTMPQFELYIDRDYTHLPSYEGVPNDATLYGGYIDVLNNRPFIELKNTSDVPITEFRMSIGNEIFHFDEFSTGFIKVKTKPPLVDVTADAPSDGDELVLTFDDPLKKNEFVHFQIKLGSDDCPECGPSFQAALFNVCHNGTTMGDGKSEVTVNGISFGQWPEYAYSPYVEGHYAPLAMTKTLNPPRLYPFFGTPAVPEPTGLLLAFIALCPMAAYRAPRCRRVRAA